MERISVCRLAEIPETGSRGFDIEQGDSMLALVIVRRGATVYAYRNRCPHTGVTLEWMPHQFLNAEQTHIQCATHGALFRIEDGYCVFGPCSGARLEHLASEVEDGQIKVTLPATE